jgi:hypothetical protein
MFYMWLLDDRQVLPIHGKHYDRDLFLFICLSIMLWASSTLKQSDKPRVKKPPPPAVDAAPVAAPRDAGEAERGGSPPKTDPNDWKGDYLGREQTEEWKG